MSRYQDMPEASDIAAKGVAAAIMNIAGMGVYTSVAGIKGEIKIPKLGFDNYQVWAQIMKVNLIGRKLWDVTNGSIPKPGEDQPLGRTAWEFDDAIAMGCIYGAVDDDQLQHIVLLQTSNAQWEKLKKIHQALGKIRLMPLMRRLNHYKVSADETIDHIASEMSRIAAVITDIKSELKPADLTMALILMDSVDAPQYNMAKAFLEDKEDVSFSMVIEKFKEIEQKSRDGETVRILETANKASDGECFFCKKKGHFKAKCHKWLKTDAGKKATKEKEKEEKDNDSDDAYRSTFKAPGGRNKKQGARGRGGRRGHQARRADQKEVEEDDSDSDSQSEYGRMARDSGRSFKRSEGPTGSKSTLSKEWIIDSGASRHMTPDRGLFVNMIMTRTWVTVASGQ